jgi:hypothetical protein
VLPIPDARAPQSETNIIESKSVVKKRGKAVKEYAPHEHFGSPLNICRICGEKYSYSQKPHNDAPSVTKN